MQILWAKILIFLFLFHLCKLNALFSSLHHHVAKQVGTGLGYQAYLTVVLIETQNKAEFNWHSCNYGDRSANSCKNKLKIPQVSRRDTEYTWRANLSVNKLRYFIALFQRTALQAGQITKLLLCCWGAAAWVSSRFVSAYLRFFFLLISTIPCYLAVPIAYIFPCHFVAWSIAPICLQTHRVIQNLYHRKEIAS